MRSRRNLNMAGGKLDFSRSDARPAASTLPYFSGPSGNQNQGNPVDSSQGAPLQGIPSASVTG
jgi:hypothetical protein